MPARVPSPAAAAAARAVLGTGAALAATCLAMLAASAGCQLDWSLEAPAADGGGHGPVDDGGAMDAGDAAPGPADAALDCAGALVCTDFADGSVTPPFDLTFITPGGTLRVDVDGGASPHGSTLYVMRPGTSQSADSAYAQTPIYGQPFTRASLAVDVLLDQIDSANAHACVLGISLNDGLSAEHTLRVLVGTNDAHLQDRVPVGDGGAQYTLSGTLPQGQWSRVVLSVTVAGHVTVTFDGANVLDVMVGSLGASSAPTKAFIGINFTDATTSAYTFRFDNVRFDAQ